MEANDNFLESSWKILSKCPWGWKAKKWTIWEKISLEVMCTRHDFARQGDKLHARNLIKHLACQMSKSISFDSSQILENFFVHFEDCHVLFWSSLESLHLAKNQESYGLRNMWSHTELHACPCRPVCAQGMCMTSSILLNFKTSYLLQFSMVLSDSKLMIKLTAFSLIGSRKNSICTSQFYLA